MHHRLTLALNCHTKLMRRQMKRKHILKLKTEGYVDQTIKDLTHRNRSYTTKRFGQSQKCNNTKDMSNGPWETTHGNMGI